MKKSIIPQAGRPTKKPKGQLDPEWFGWDLLAEDCRKALSKIKAPDYLQMRLPFLFRCARSMEGTAPRATKLEQFAEGTLFNLKRLLATAENDSANWVVAKNPVMDAIRLVQLFAKDPDAFLQCMAALRKVINRAKKSREWSVAWRLAVFPNDWFEKAEGLAGDYTELSNFKVTPKLIEKARRRVRDHKRGF